VTENERRPSARQRGYNTRWQKARKTYLTQHPLCVMCKKQGRITAATVVNHKVAHRGDQDLFWDVSNWEPLCKRHHDSDAQIIDRTGKPPRTIGVDGWPAE
jgi:5-methylcytosine-specific restriction protein A